MAENEHIPKRRRGGQPGNQNAVKHGFYSRGGRRRLEDIDALVRDCHALLKVINDGDFSDLQNLSFNMISNNGNFKGV